jgi:hypothetical protein
MALAGGAPHSKSWTWHGLALALALSVLPACAGVTYQKPGKPVTPRAGEAIVFGRVRFFYDGKEFFPWQVKIDVFPQANTERHVWLLRLRQRTVSAELHPEQNGSLAIWLASGDYALVGSTEALGAGVGAFYVVALFRVPADTAAMSAGDLIFKTESHEGGHWSSAFGDAFVTAEPAALARDSLEKKFGTLPEPFTVSAWCAGDSLPAFNDPDLAKRGKELLDRDCPGRR